MSAKKIPYPPFNEFTHFIGEVSREKNDPNLRLHSPDDSVNLESNRAENGARDYEKENLVQRYV
jgi:hypothetical protein